MSSGMFVIREDGQVTQMASSPYESEDALQELLATHPELIPGADIDPEAPRRWLLVSRELGVPGEPDGADRWSLDHLFIDQDAVPTLVEVKRSTDTRIRREVLGQMLDYAANAVAYWPVEAIQQAMARRCEKDGLAVDAVLAEFLGGGRDANEFWQLVKTNLQAGRIRLLFVADEIPTELRRVVEFLNQQMDPAEVLAVDVRQYVGQGLRVVAPRVYGQTEQAQLKKAAGPRASRVWNAESWFAALAERGVEAEVRGARAIYDWALARGLRIEWGSGAKDGSFKVSQDSTAGVFSPITVYHGYKFAQVELRVGSFDVPPMDTAQARADFLQRVQALPDVVLSPSPQSSRPNLRLVALAEGDNLRRFLDVLDWAVTRVAGRAR